LGAAAVGRWAGSGGLGIFWTAGARATRFAGTAEEHRTILLVDPSNNVLEFGQYEDPRLPY
jgi:extradiol dioxygenase family protein